VGEPISGIVVLRFDENGEQTYHVIGDTIRFFIVDERAPHDRVYEWLDREHADAVKAILGEDRIGSNQDGRHAAVRNAILSDLEGRARLKVIDGVATRGLDPKPKPQEPH
jgi:hypothetical protein